MALACQIHSRFIADSSRIHASFFQSQKIKIMSDSRHFHGSFMHFHIQVLPGYRLPKSIGKNYPKSRCWLSICFFCLISASFLAICQIHVGFMALSCYFHGTFLYVGFIADSCHFHGSFMALSHTSLTWVQSAKIYWKKLSKKSVLVVDLFFLPNFSFMFGNMSDSCRFHGTFMALSSF